jgi:16S rRNA (guanine527-N7)-methyltransferase
VKVGGHFLAPKTGDISQEIEEAGVASRIVGGGRPRLHPFMLPGESEERVVVAIKKVKGTPPGYPRRIGVAKAQPLGTQE